MLPSAAGGLGAAGAADQVVPGAGDAFGGPGGRFGQVVGGQVEQERAVQGGAELDGEHVEVGGAEVHLAEQHPDVQLGRGRAGSGRAEVAAVQGGAGDVAVVDQEA